MSVQLEIQDGSPNWWLSPDIWTVPGNDPQGAPGMPIVGKPCYVWARVHNTGTDSVQNATVRYYWANPAVGFDRNTANHIGNANVSLNAGETQDVLCLVPWMPVFVNNGHECVVAEAFHPSLDPLPASPDFNVPYDRHVAQRNLSVVMMAMKMSHFSLSFQVCNPSRLAQRFRITAKLGRTEELKPLLPHLGPNLNIRGKGTIKNIGFVNKPCPDEDERQKTVPAIEGIEVAPGACLGLSVVGELEGDAALLHVVQEADQKAVGGLSILVLRGNDKDQDKDKKGRG